MTITKDTFTNQILDLPVGDGHKLHIVDWGDKNAKTPFFYLHGGPGGHMKEKYKTYFDPKKHRVILYDQRGCGESTPYGSLKNNDTKHLAADIIKIADHLKIQHFNLYGYSWGSTLALYTAINYPKRIKHLVIGGVYLGDNDLDTMINHLGTFYPEVMHEIMKEIPEKHHLNPAEYLQDQIINGTKSAKKRACYLMNTVECTIMSYDSDYALEEPYEEYDPVPAEIENYFLANNCFLNRNYLLTNASKITADVHIIQGRSDLVCPPINAYLIAKKIKNAQIYWANSNHHSTRELTSLAHTVISLLPD